MKKSKKCETDQLIGKFLYKEDTNLGQGYTFVSLSLNNFESGKYKIDEGVENIILSIFLSNKEIKFLNSLKENDIVTYSAKMPLPSKEKGRGIVSEYILHYLVENGMKYWDFRHYKDKIE